MTSLLAPEAPEDVRPTQRPSVSPAPPEPPSRRGVFGWVQRSPKKAFWTIFVAALLLGAVIGAAASNKQKQLDAANARATRAEAQVSRLKGEVTDTKAQVVAANDRGDELEAQVT